VLERNDCSDMVEVMLMVLVEEPCCRKFKAICITDKMILLFINTIILMLNRTMILLVTKCIMDKKTILFIQTPILLINRHGLKKRILVEELWCKRATWPLKKHLLPIIRKHHGTIMKIPLRIMEILSFGMIIKDLNYYF